MSKNEPSTRQQTAATAVSGWRFKRFLYEGGKKIRFIKKNDPDRLEMNKYCKFCRKHTLHKETK